MLSLGVGVCVCVCVRERERERERERQEETWAGGDVAYMCVLGKKLDFILKFGSSKMMVIILIMCCLSKIKTWHPYLFSQLIFFYLSMRFQKQRSIYRPEKSSQPGVQSVVLVKAVSLLGVVGKAGKSCDF
jgi:hypothetical protein